MPQTKDNIDKNKIKVARIRVDNSMLCKTCVVKSGDLIEVDFTQKPKYGEYAFFSNMTKQFIAKYTNQTNVNVYKILSIIMNS